MSVLCCFTRAKSYSPRAEREREQHLLIGASICTLELAPSSSLSSPELRSLRARVIVLTIVGGHLCFPLSAYDWTVWPITRPHFFFFLLFISGRNTKWVPCGFRTPTSGLKVHVATYQATSAGHTKLSSDRLLNSEGSRLFTSPCLLLYWGRRLRS